MFASRSLLSRWQRSLRFRVMQVVVCVLFINSLVVAVDPPPDKPTTYPAWWFSQGLIVPKAPSNTAPSWSNGDYPAPDDYAVANVGQLKQMATKAAAELNAQLPGGATTGTAAGPAINALIARWNAEPLPGTPARDDYAALTLGQLKNVAKLFYDQLIAVHFTDHYPWDASGLPADDYAVANVGQLKCLFNFDVSYSTLNDGLPDWWVQYYQLGDVGDSSVADNDPDGDGVSNLLEYQAGTDPTDYYNGQVVALALVSGGDQQGPPRNYLPDPIVVSVLKSDGTPWVGSPVTFSTADIQGGFATVDAVTNNPQVNWQSSLTVQTDPSGQAQVCFEPLLSVNYQVFASAATKSFPWPRAVTTRMPRLISLPPLAAPPLPPPPAIRYCSPGVRR